MSVVIKRSEGGVPIECPYGCCTNVYGKHVKKVRRAIKRGQRQRERAAFAELMELEGDED